MGLTDILTTARDSMQTQQYGLSVTGQNVANVNTPGYARREALIETQAFGGRSYGSVKASGLRQAVDEFTERRFFSTTALSAAANQRNDDLSQVESVFNETDGAGITTSMSKLFASFSALASNPTDTTTRSTVLEQARDFAATIQGAADDLSTFQADQLSKAKTVASQVNQKAAKIAQLNTQIQSAVAQGQDAADLKDQRTSLVTDLSGLVDVRTLMDDKGNLTIQSSGTTLVEGQFARSLDVSLTSDGKMQILAKRPGDATGSDVTAFVTGGKLAGIRDARDVDGAALGKQLDQLAYDVAHAVNGTQSTGYGADGSTGQNLFNVSSTVAGAARSLSLDAGIDGHPEKVAASSSPAGLPGNADNAIALGQLADAKIANGGTRTAIEAYSDIVGDIGLRKQNAQSDADTRDGILAQVKTMRESASGVNLDEEMVNLTKFQRAYEASAKVLSTADQLLADLMDSLKR
jgi:flagellar hook-associated protein 1 FlgK